jgi:glycosyltransferase involved in cell wall biosynthesis
MNREILPRVIFSPAQLAIGLAEGLAKQGQEVTLFTPGAVDTFVPNVTANLSYFEAELAGRDDTYIDLLKKHPLTFITLARQVQAELLADAFARANNSEFDVIHVYTNEEELGLNFAPLCTKPVVFTHHDPFNFLVRYKSVMPKFARLPWISLSQAQRAGMPVGTNWLANIYHGLPVEAYLPEKLPTGGYIAYLGRIIEPKGVHLAIAAVKSYNQQYGTTLQLKIAGKHYAGQAKDTYWQERIEPEIDNQTIFYEGFISEQSAKQTLLANAEALLVPSLFEEPFGMVTIEALACGTPAIGLNSGALPEVIADGKTGYVVAKSTTEAETVERLVKALADRQKIHRAACRTEFEKRFTVERMCTEHLQAYTTLVKY